MRDRAAGVRTVTTTGRPTASSRRADRRAARAHHGPSPAGAAAAPRREQRALAVGDARGRDRERADPLPQGRRIGGLRTPRRARRTSSRSAVGTSARMSRAGDDRDGPPRTAHVADRLALLDERALLNPSKPRFSERGRVGEGLAAAAEHDADEPAVPALGGRDHAVARAGREAGLRPDRARVQPQEDVPVLDAARAARRGRDRRGTSSPRSARTPSCRTRPGSGAAGRARSSVRGRRARSARRTACRACPSCAARRFMSSMNASTSRSRRSRAPSAASLADCSRSA